MNKNQQQKHERTLRESLHLELMDIKEEVMESIERYGFSVSSELKGLEEDEDLLHCDLSFARAVLGHSGMMNKLTEKIDDSRFSISFDETDFSEAYGGFDKDSAEAFVLQDHLLSIKRPENNKLPDLFQELEDAFDFWDIDVEDTHVLVLIEPLHSPAANTLAEITDSVKNDIAPYYLSGIKALQNQDYHVDVTVKKVY